MESRDLGDGRACFISDDGEVAIVIDENQGEVLRLEIEGVTFDQMELLHHISQNEPVSLSDLEKEYDAASRRLTECLNTLFEAGEVYEPQPNQIQVVQTTVEED